MVWRFRLGKRKGILPEKNSDQQPLLSRGNRLTQTHVENGHYNAVCVPVKMPLDSVTAK